MYFGRAGFLQKENTAEDGTEFPFWPGLLFSDRYSYVYTSFLCARFFLIICSFMIYPTVLRHKLFIRLISEIAGGFSAF